MQKVFEKESEMKKIFIVEYDEKKASEPPTAEFVKVSLKTCFPELKIKKVIQIPPKEREKDTGIILKAYKNWPGSIG